MRYILQLFYHFSRGKDSVGQFFGAYSQNKIPGVTIARPAAPMNGIGLNYHMIIKFD